MSTRILAARLAPAALLCALAGCGGKASDVTGVVTYKGKPLAMGNVSFVGPDGIPRTGMIGPDGRYAVSGVALGVAKVTVSSPNPAAAAGGRGGAGRKGGEGRGGKGREGAPKEAAPESPPPDAELAKLWVAIPEAYSDPMKSSLSTAVQSGINTYDIPLK